MQANYIAGTPYVGANVVMKAGPGGNRGEFTAWDPVQKKAAWTIKEDLPLWSGALATAGDLVFYGTMDGWFKAVDAEVRRPEMAVQDRLRHHRPADRLSRTGRSRIRRHPVGRRRLGRVPSSAATSTRATRLRRSALSARFRISSRGPHPGGTLYVFALPQP